MASSTQRQGPFSVTNRATFSSTQDPTTGIDFPSDGNMDFYVNAVKTMAFTSGATTTYFDIVGAAITTGKALDISDLDAVTTGKAIHVDATGITHTSGILVHLDSASTAMTGAGRILLVDHTADFNDSGGIVAEFKSVHTTGTGLQFTMDSITDGFGIDGTFDALTTGAAMRLITSSTALTTAGNVLYVQASGDFADTGGAVVEIESAHTVGVGLLMTMDAVTTGFGLDMTADALTTGAGARFISSSTGLTTAGNVLYVQASGDFADAGGQVVEIESAHTVGTGLQLTMDAVTAGLGMQVTADALTSGVALQLTSTSSDTGLYELVNATIDDAAAVGAVNIRCRNDSTGLAANAGGSIAFASDAVDCATFKVRKFVELFSSSTLFDATATTDTKTLFSSTLDELIFNAKIVLDTQFAGPSHTDLTITIGDGSDVDGFLTITGNMTSDSTGTEYTGRGALWDTSAEGGVWMEVDTWVATATATGDNLDDLTAGQVTFYFLVLQW